MISTGFNMATWRFVGVWVDEKNHEQPRKPLTYPRSAWQVEDMSKRDIFRDIFRDMVMAKIGLFDEYKGSSRGTRRVVEGLSGLEKW